MKTKKVNERLNTCLYVPKTFYSETQDFDKLINKFKDSGFSTIINWSFHIRRNYNDK